MEQDEPRQAPLAQLEDQEELKKRYAFVSSQVLRRWMSVVVGPHREAMAALLPVDPGHETDTCSVMAWGFDPMVSARSPFHGAQMAVIESIAKIIAAGGSRKQF